VKEELVLAGPDAPTTYDFRVALSPGLAAQETAEGGITIVDAEGTERARFAAPFVVDASQSGEGLADGPGYSTEAVSLRIVERAPDLLVRLAVDPAWLSAPERAWPVVVDPSVTITGSSHDTYLGSGAYANTNYGSSTIMGIGGGTTRFRTLQQRAILSFFDEPAVVTGASLQLYVTNDTSASSQREVAVHEVTSSWSSGQATWNNRLSGTPWAQAGGELRLSAPVEGQRHHRRPRLAVVPRHPCLPGLGGQHQAQPRGSDQVPRRVRRAPGGLRQHQPHRLHHPTAHGGQLGASAGSA
jgi:hypothetical protein